MSIKQWFRSLFGLPSPEVQRAEKPGELPRLPEDWRDDRVPRANRERFAPISSVEGLGQGRITPHQARLREERVDAMFRDDEAEYRRARRRELEAYEEGVRTQQQADVVNDLIAYEVARDAIEDAEERAERAEEQLHEERHEHHEPEHAYEPQPDAAYTPPAPEPTPVYEAPQPVYEAPAQPEYQAPEPSYPESSSSSDDSSW